ncbi:dihydrodipicolinate synthase family protein [Ramlibacter sp. AW1]|uniref:Dihydrodipicolinate synthase family protein n=1 Tax=Ramlibacter aurantiacus TaxID=2801330 RepID=A0A936ZTY5_9BURK|nr:dihydrodipicolinate synthase family protein [Ramlibacter aurantiacus]MBL0423438.1 dihydrodipicolinate synthase family protein [Ramlibacter aurantiacus]
MIAAQDIRGMYAIIATPAREGADRLGATEGTVDLDETERLIEALVQDGVSGLIALGTTGECATLSEPDYRAFVDCVLKTVRRRVPTFIGATALGGHETVRRLRFVSEQGADGTLLGLPMWQPVSQDMAVSFYAGISELFPDLGIMVYANARAFRFNFPVEFWEAVFRSAPTVMSAKCSRADGLREMISRTQGRIHFLPSDMVVQQFHALAPETTTACWATAAGMNPMPSVELMRAISAGDSKAAGDWVDAIGWANEPILPLVAKPEIFAQYNIQVEKTRINEAGYSRCGPVRPPYQHLPQEYANYSREAGRRWASICMAWQPGIGFKLRPWEAGHSSAGTDLSATTGG